MYFLILESEGMIILYLHFNESQPIYAYKYYASKNKRVKFFELSVKFCGNVKINSNYNHGHNILRLFDTLPNFPFTASETKRDY